MVNLKVHVSTVLESPVGCWLYGIIAIYEWSYQPSTKKREDQPVFEHSCFLPRNLEILICWVLALSFPWRFWASPMECSVVSRRPSGLWLCISSIPQIPWIWTPGWGKANWGWLDIYLVGGFHHFLFFHTLGIMIPTDFHIFQRGRYTTNQIYFMMLYDIIRRYGDIPNSFIWIWGFAWGHYLGWEISPTVMGIEWGQICPRILGKLRGWVRSSWSLHIFATMGIYPRVN